MSVSKHPTPAAGHPRKPPNDRHGQGERKSGEAAPYGAKNEFQGYEHASDRHYNEYGHQKRMEHHNAAKSEREHDFKGGFPKAGDQNKADEPG